MKDKDLVEAICALTCAVERLAGQISQEDQNTIDNLLDSSRKVTLRMEKLSRALSKLDAET